MSSSTGAHRREEAEAQRDGASPGTASRCRPIISSARDGRGVTLVNIGVGPSNAKTITDHLAVLRPHGWLMVGHCGGLRQSQLIGDYVLAHAYLRDDHVLDDMLPPRCRSRRSPRCRWRCSRRRPRSPASAARR